LSAGRSRPLGEHATPYLLLDARYEKVRQNGIVQDAAILIAVRVGAYGNLRRPAIAGRRVLGVSVALSEHEVHWRDFLKSLVERGLAGVRLCD
jgi:transposase-like protein